MSDDILKIQQKNQEYAERHLDMIKNLFLNKYIVIQNEEVVASFATYHEASEYGVKTYGMNGTHLIYHVEDVPAINFVAHAIL
jgi:hypothetical protein